MVTTTGQFGEEGRRVLTSDDKDTAGGRLIKKRWLVAMIFNESIGI